MSIADELQRLIQDKASIRSALQAKGVTVPPSTTLDGYPALIMSIEGEDPGPSVPAALTSGDWSLTPGVNELVINILSLPTNGGSPITRLDYRIGAGAPTALSGTGIGPRTVLAAGGVAASVQVRQANAQGDGPWSDTKTQTPESGGGGTGDIAWQSVARTDTRTWHSGFVPEFPVGVQSSDLLVAILTGCTRNEFENYSAVSGWTLHGSQFCDFGNLGVAVWTAPGTISQSGSWSTTGTGFGVSMDIHRVTGANLAAPVRTLLMISTETPGIDVASPNLLSPSIDVLAGNLVLAHYYQPQSNAPVNDPPQEGYTRRMAYPDPSARSTLERNSKAAGSTGTISHNPAASVWQGRVAFTLELAAN